MERVRGARELVARMVKDDDVVSAAMCATTFAIVVAAAVVVVGIAGAGAGAAAAESAAAEFCLDRVAAEMRRLVLGTGDVARAVRRGAVEVPAQQ